METCGVPQHRRGRHGIQQLAAVLDGLEAVVAVEVSTDVSLCAQLDFADGGLQTPSERTMYLLSQFSCLGNTLILQVCLTNALRRRSLVSPSVDPALKGDSLLRNVNACLPRLHFMLEFEKYRWWLQW